MSLVAIGVNHHSAPLELLEQLAVRPDDLPKALASLTSRDNLSEAVLLSTCNRTEIYAVAERFHGGLSDVADFIAETALADPIRVADHLYVHHDDAAIRHLFAVVSGLDFVVLGENEILGQARSAWEAARTESAAGPVLNLVFRHAVEVGKRARTETAIARHTTSVSQAAVELATDRLGGLSGRRVLVLGAGEMADGMVRALAGAEPAELLVANRTAARAEALAERGHGRAVPLDRVPDLLASVDVLLTGTGASAALVDQADLVGVVATRADRPLLIVDVAVPRDVDPAVADLPGVTLLDMEAISRHAEAGRAERAGEVSAVQAIIDDEARRLSAVRSARELSPLISALHGRADALRRAELDRHRAALASLDPRQLDAVEALTKGLVNKLLHQPTAQVKDAAGSPKGDRLADSLRDLFDLP